MTEQHRNLRTIAGTLAVLLVLAVVAFGTLVAKYRAQDEVLAECYASAEASTYMAFAADALLNEELEDFEYHLNIAEAALTATGEDNIDDAFITCDAKFQELVG